MCIAIFRAFHGLLLLVCLFIYLFAQYRKYYITGKVRSGQGFCRSASLAVFITLLYEVDPWIGGGVLRGQVDSNHCAF